MQRVGGAKHRDRGGQSAVWGGGVDKAESIPVRYVGGEFALQTRRVTVGIAASEGRSCGAKIASNCQLMNRDSRLEWAAHHCESIRPQ